MSSPKSKRPGSRHHSSFIQRLHRRHDERHHGRESEHQDEAEQPLIAEEHPDSVSETESYAQEQEPRRTSRVTTVLGNIRETTKDTFQKNFKRLLFFACGILAVVAILEALALLYFHHSLPSAHGDLCLTPACIDAASGILENLHPRYHELDPCDNFAMYACGGFRAEDGLPDGQSSISTESVLAEEVNAVLHKILEQNGSSVATLDMSIFQKVQNAYVACNDEISLKKLGARPLEDIINGIKQHFIAAKSSLRKTSNFQMNLNLDFTDTNKLTAPLVELAKLGIEGFLPLEIQIDPEKTRDHIISIRPPSQIGLPTKELYDDKDMVNAYTKAVETSLKQFYPSPGNSSGKLGSNGVHPSVNGLAHDVVQFESQIVQFLTSTVPSGTGSSYEKLTYDKFEELIPQLSLSNIVRALASSNYEGDHVIVSSTKYVRGLSKVLAGTRSETLQAFCVWKAVQNFADMVEHDALIPWKELSKKFSIQTTTILSARWRTCVASVNADFGWILSKLYVDREFTSQVKTYGAQVVLAINQWLDWIVSDLDWLSDNERQIAQKKLALMKVKLGYPEDHPNIEDTAALEAFYAGISIQPDTFLQNKVQSIRARVSREWSKLDQSSDQDEWNLFSTATLTQYDMRTNELVVPAAFMRAPFFYENNVPSYLSFGAFGVLIGHQMVHAIDEMGSQHSSDGTLRDWWSNGTRAVFQEKEACFVEQYSKYSIDGPDGEVFINGTSTLPENIADIGGIRAAFVAWAVREAQDKSKDLPGLTDFTHEQLFWLSFGNGMCSKATSKALEQEVAMSKYPPKAIRILGTVADSTEFREAFSCPSKKPDCEMW